MKWRAFFLSISILSLLVLSGCSVFEKMAGATATPGKPTSTPKPTAKPKPKTLTVMALTPATPTTTPFPPTDPDKGIAFGQILCAGKPWVGVNVYLLEFVRGDTYYRLYDTGLTDIDGRWVFANVPPGLYAVSLRYKDIGTLVITSGYLQKIGANEAVDFGALKMGICPTPVPTNNEIPNIQPVEESTKESGGEHVIATPTAQVVHQSTATPTIGHGESTPTPDGSHGGLTPTVGEGHSEPTPAPGH